MAKLTTWTTQEKIFVILMAVVLILSTTTIAKAKGWLIPEQPPVVVEDGIVSLSSMTLEQKIAQMVIVHGRQDNIEAWQRLQTGGIHLFALERQQLFSEQIARAQEGMSIPFFVTVDLEGCLNPFANFRAFPAVSDITSVGKAFEKGAEEGKYLASLGITINFAPVVDLDDQIWHCRSFPGDERDVAELAEAYILGLQKEGIIATAKHYPGKTLAIRDPHKFIVAADISEQDLYPFVEVSPIADSIMVNHLTTSGIVDSGGLPAATAPAVIEHLKANYSGLIISDEIMMLGLRQFYPTLDEMYIAVFAAGNDLILNFNDDPSEIYRMVQVVKEAVEQGAIEEERIDESVTKILEAKGFRVR